MASYMLRAASQRDPKRSDAFWLYWQRLVNLTFANIKLFDEILLLITGYTGERIDYETLGLPSGPKFSRTQEAESETSPQP